MTVHNSLLLGSGEHRGFAFEVRHNSPGFRLGYVAVPPGHPWHCVSYADLDVQVHGGLTYAKAGCVMHPDAWEVGFDCHHYGDAPDLALSSVERRMGLPGYGHIWTQQEVEDECRALCEQAAEAGTAEGVKG